MVNCSALARFVTPAHLVPLLQGVARAIRAAPGRLRLATYRPASPATSVPVSAREQYFAQLVPNTETSYPDSGRITIVALAALLDRIGPAVIMVH